MIEITPLLIFSIIWFILPPYIANMAPAVWGGGPSLDGGRLFFDGKRLFGKGKTIKGAVVGILAGVIISLVQHIVLPFPSFGYALLRGFLMGTGAIVGDLFGSFIKRRVNIETGDSAPLLDQLDFMLGVIVFMYPLGLPSLEIVLISVIITPIVHLVSNSIWYLAGKKEVWW
ncbi:MAG: CDP-2,3-bis-(O-geranylgeranyl)-sn-glycerol synthase [Methanofastidiosum sp.]|jgi:CDP-2,3-bis-(O-geranylgeranyl)-sn-glycerol synthase|nr:CDP-2,3-bis-(O-geranylgeranyl)-sn-glycerol synthase [Bacteroidales bacterium]